MMAKKQDKQKHLNEPVFRKIVEKHTKKTENDDVEKWWNKYRENVKSDINRDVKASPEEVLKAWVDLNKFYKSDPYAPAAKRHKKELEEDIKKLRQYIRTSKGKNKESSRTDWKSVAEELQEVRLGEREDLLKIIKKEDEKNDQQKTRKKA